RGISRRADGARSKTSRKRSRCTNLGNGVRKHIKKKLKPFRVLSPLHSASRQVQIFMNGRCRPLGVSTVEAHLLGYCQSRGPCPISEILKVLGEKKSTMTAIMDRLEAAKLITRRLNPSDRRSWIVEITREGDNLANKLRREYEDFEYRLLRRIRPQDLEGFKSVMDAIALVTQVALTSK